MKRMNKKTKRIAAGIMAGVLILAMVIGSASFLFVGNAQVMLGLLG
jgi:hypothetical protein